MKVTKQGVRDLNPPRNSNPSKVRICAHVFGPRERLHTGWDSYRGDHPVFGRMCKFCPEYIEDKLS